MGSIFTFQPTWGVTRTQPQSKIRGPSNHCWAKQGQPGSTLEFNTWTNIWIRLLSWLVSRAGYHLKFFVDIGWYLFFTEPVRDVSKPFFKFLNEMFVLHRFSIPFWLNTIVCLFYKRFNLTTYCKLSVLLSLHNSYYTEALTNEMQTKQIYRWSKTELTGQEIRFWYTVQRTQISTYSTYCTSTDITYPALLFI